MRSLTSTYIPLDKDRYLSSFLPSNSHNKTHIRFAYWSEKTGLNRSSHILILYRCLRTKICCLLPTSVNITTEEKKRSDIGICQGLITIYGHTPTEQGDKVESS